MTISLTPSAAERVRTFMSSRGKGIGLRLGIKQTGCSGYAYVVSYADQVGADDSGAEVERNARGAWIIALDGHSCNERPNLVDATRPNR